jgi:hypothetical protein
MALDDPWNPDKWHSHAGVLLTPRGPIGANLVLVDCALIVRDDPEERCLTLLNIGGRRDANATAAEVYQANGLHPIANSERCRAPNIAAGVTPGMFAAGMRLLAKEVLKGGEPL